LSAVLAKLRLAVQEPAPLLSLHCSKT